MRSLATVLFATSLSACGRISGDDVGAVSHAEDASASEVGAEATAADAVVETTGDTVGLAPSSSASTDPAPVQPALPPPTIAIGLPGKRAPSSGARGCLTTHPGDAGGLVSQSRATIVRLSPSLAEKTRWTSPALPFDPSRPSGATAMQVAVRDGTLFVAGTFSGDLTIGATTLAASSPGEPTRGVPFDTFGAAFDP